MRKWNSGWLLGLDPGKTTGAALGYLDAKTPLKIHRTWMIPGGNDGFLEWWHGDFALEVKPAVVVSEKFEKRVGVPFADWTPLGIEQSLASLQLNLVFQKPSVKAHVPDEVLKRAGLWLPGAGHDRDAVRHLLAYAKLTAHVPTVKSVWPPQS